MPKLFIIRHAIAEDREVFKKRGLPDAERPLTTDGVKKMNRICKKLKRIEPKMDLFFQSPLLRSQQTVDILKMHYTDADVVTTPHLDPKAAFTDLKNEILQQCDKKIALVGHEDHLSQFTHFLLSGKRETPLFTFKKGGIACLNSNKQIF